jgi:hypothetical protein
MRSPRHSGPKLLQAPLAFHFLAMTFPAPLAAPSPCRVPVSSTCCAPCRMGSFHATVSLRFLARTQAHGSVNEAAHLRKTFIICIRVTAFGSLMSHRLGLHVSDNLCVQDKKACQAAASASERYAQDLKSALGCQCKACAERRPDEAASAVIVARVPRKYEPTPEKTSNRSPKRRS